MLYDARTRLATAPAGLNPVLTSTAVPCTGQVTIIGLGGCGVDLSDSAGVLSAYAVLAMASAGQG